MKTKRQQLMSQYKANAAEYDRRGDVVLRTQQATAWRELATEAEAAKAPKYLTWIGR
jgi:PPE-repeat protein